VTAPIPLTIVGGFLGAGKTCVLNHILRHAPGASIAVLVNDFGAVNIDARLIVSVEGETVSLANGCVCCTIREDLLTEVIKLFRRKPRPEHIVIETSGVSNPLVVAETFLNPAARRFVELRNVISVLDAELAMSDHAEYRALAMDQIAVADLVVVNKTDLVAPRQLPALRRHIDAISPRARIWETSMGVVPLDLVFDESFPQASNCERPAPAPDRRDDHARQFAAWVYRSERAWSFSEIQRAVDKLPRDIYRAKGTVRLDLGTKDYGVFHMTGKRSWLELRESDSSEGVTTELIFVGRPGTVTDDSIRMHFDAAIEEAQSSARDGTGYIVTDLRAFTVLFG
jgi:G3E family GTPase